MRFKASWKIVWIWKTAKIGYFSYGDYKGFRAADISISVKSHLIGFAAEKSRRDDTVEQIDTFFENYGMNNN